MDQRQAMNDTTMGGAALLATLLANNGAKIEQRTKAQMVADILRKNGK